MNLDQEEFETINLNEVFTPPEETLNLNKARPTLSTRQPLKAIIVSMLLVSAGSVALAKLQLYRGTNKETKPNSNSSSESYSKTNKETEKNSNGNGNGGQYGGQYGGEGATKHVDGNKNTSTPQYNFRHRD